MDPKENRRVALLSIHPHFAEAIMNRTKLVEFRKTRFAADVREVIVYSTSPIMSVIGSFEIGSIYEASPEKLWTRYESVAGIDKRAFFAYYADRTAGIAIEVSRVLRLDGPVPLSRLGRSLVPPQAFLYVSYDRYCALFLSHRSHRRSAPAIDA